MKYALVALATMSLWPGRTRAQTNSVTPIETQSAEISTILVVPNDTQAPSQNLPDAPILVLPSRQDGPMPCPDGDGMPCALLGGRLYFRDRSHMTEHDKTWGNALKNPLILGAVSANLGAVAWDYRATRSCIDAHRCTEANPILGQSRTQQLAVGFGLTTTFYFLAAKLKQHGNGNAAFALLSGNALMHVYQALRAQYP